MEEIRLSPEDKKALEDLAPEILDLEREVSKAERAGIDVAEIKDRFTKAKALRDGILREYV